MIESEEEECGGEEKNEPLLLICLHEKFNPSFVKLPFIILQMRLMVTVNRRPSAGKLEKHPWEI